MSEVRVRENETLDSALRRSVNVLCLASCLKLEKESTMISQALDVRRKQKQQEEKTLRNSNI